MRTATWNVITAKIKNWPKKSKRRAEWGRYIQEANVHTGL
jgi:hypothetical protein